jgi:hypothetical protein
MNKEQIIETQKRVGTIPDGFWGPKSTKAAQQHLRKIAAANGALTRFPTAREVQSGKSVYGAPGVKGVYGPPMRKINIPFGVWLYGNQDSAELRAISIHEKCADALLSVYQRIRAAHTDRELANSGFRNYFGCYNPRKMRGGSSWSMHAWAVAVDHDASRNRNRSHWPVNSSMPLSIMECFAAEGATCAGAAW